MDYAKFREDERSGWSERAETYALATARATKQSIPALLSHARLFPGARVLDAGCGPGYVAACAALLGASPCGVDFAEDMVRVARASFPDISFAVADVEQLPFDDNSLDAVLSNIVLFHVTDPAKAMAEAYRVLSPGGVFAFSQWLGPQQSDCYKMLFTVLQRHCDMSIADPAPDAYVLSDPERVRSMMQAAGFENIRYEHVPNTLHAAGDSFFDFFMTFGVRVPLIVARQDPQVRATIRREIDAAAARYLDDGVYKIPMPSLVISGQRPL
jgi:ubiquinone/menaquinone biosynthesis C-methylase UbiE